MFSEPPQFDAPKAGLLNSSGPLPIFLVGWGAVTLACIPAMPLLIRVALGFFGAIFFAEVIFVFGSFTSWKFSSFASGRLVVEEGNRFAELTWFGLWRYRCKLTGELRLEIHPYENSQHLYRLFLSEEKEDGLQFWLGFFDEVEATRLQCVLQKRLSTLHT
ncbi:MAG: hypothetical protein H7Y37_03210 [Anaerolineae bacterium]|nr:hypothetical protein [Gloeobacterales cyanobacterium ES-bin-313]